MSDAPVRLVPLPLPFPEAPEPLDQLGDRILSGAVQLAAATAAFGRPAGARPELARAGGQGGPFGRTGWPGSAP